MSKFVFFDLETGGLNPLCHPITQIAAVAVNASDLTEIDAFERKLKFDVDDADPEALAKNHFDEAVWEQSAVAPSIAFAEFSAFLNRHSTVRQVARASGRVFHVAQMAGHNVATFDMPFLQSWAKLEKKFLPASFLTMDTLQRAIWYFNERDCERPENLKLETLCRYFGVPIADGEAHDALADVEACINFYRALRSQP